MKTFAVYIHGNKPTLDQLGRFFSSYIPEVDLTGTEITVSSIGNETKVDTFKTTLFTEAQLDAHSIAWEFIEVESLSLSSFGEVDTVSTKERIFKVTTFDGDTFICNLKHIKLEDVKQIKRLYHMWDFEWTPFGKDDLKEMIIVNNM